MRRDHHRLGRDLGGCLPDSDAVCPQFSQHGFVVDQIAQDRQGLAVRGLKRQGDGVLDPKAHPQMFSADDFHGWQSRQCAGGLILAAPHPECDTLTPAGRWARALPVPIRLRFFWNHKHINFVTQSKRPGGFICVQKIYFGLFCRTICSSRLMYSAKALRPAAVSEQVVSGRLFWYDLATET